VPTTLYLRKSAEGPVRAARGPHAAEVHPGAYADVPEPLADVLVAAGATRRSRPTEGEGTTEEE
jgi:hypothetical protein